MHLQKLEIVGFKSFADRIGMDFLPPSTGSKGITAVVGPNGSGKSNVADAIRWVLGEQSAKTLRGKKSEDVIFSGSERRSRSGFAEVTMTLNNEDGKLPIESPEVGITRRIYRDGESEYLINRSKVRLSDIQLILAQAQFGARTYSVIGQGMVDSILVASPQERKEFFDEAAGVRQYQLKRQQSVNKVDAARENLAQAEMLLNEIEPRLRSLSRQVKRLEEKDSLEEELHATLHEYYGRAWTDLKAQIETRQKTLERYGKEWESGETTLSEAQNELARLASQETGSGGFSELQNEHQRLTEEKTRLRSREMEIRSQLEIAKQVRQQTSAALPLSKIIEKIGGLGDRQERGIERLRKAGDLEAARATIPEFESVCADTVGLKQRLEKPVPEKSPEMPPDPKLIREMEEIRGMITAQDRKIQDSLEEIRNHDAREREVKAKFFSLQRGLQEKISAAHALERRLHDERVEMARLETRRESMEEEMSQELGGDIERIRESFRGGTIGDQPVEALSGRIQKLKYQLTLIGGIDPEAVREYGETKSRHEFLESQTVDLGKAIADLEKVIAELDVTIKSRSETAFRNINREFGRYFSTLFDGGKAELVQIRAEETAAEGGNGDAEPPAGAKPSRHRPGDIIGIDIVACPPGKRIRSVSMLSGGERAMTSIALICSIMTVNPSPFVVLDEVDAALDESNADRFSGIVRELSHRTQFIVITHNRYTMQQANVLYGVTMRDDGASQILSVNMDQVGNLKNDAKSAKPVRQRMAV
ncbi:AAA family ATPase [Candidatus Uhrbacteria bacterium]|nr:AAA family ATPase [Candidatus Uhrbacteria bacterium]